MKTKILAFAALFFSFVLQAAVEKSKSFYPKRLDDPEAIYFTPENFNIKADGRTDVSDELQKAINQVKTEKNMGIVFVPEGLYLISKTIYIPKAVRVIGYGKTRPMIVLGKNSPGYQSPDSLDKGKAKYMFWFTDAMVFQDGDIQDAGAGTFYSALSNIDLKIEDGNPQAVALRTHYAQHSFIEHCDIYIGKGKAGVFDVGNEMQDVRFFGGDYGIYTTKTSPGWQFMMIDTYFEGQREAAIRTQEAGLTIVRMTVKDVPTVIETDPNYWEKLYMEDCQLSNIGGPAIIISDEGNANNQISLRNVYCQNVPVLAAYRLSNRTTPGIGGSYVIKNFIYGLQIDDLDADPKIKTTLELSPVKTFSGFKKDIPDLPGMETWVNLKSLGAKGDGVTDDTKVIADAIEKYPVIYVPQGWYRVTKPLKLKPNTVIIALHPMATQFMISDNTEDFGGFGGPVALLETPSGGTNIVSGIGLSTGEYNARAVACKWMAGSSSYMNDVKFVGGHGNIPRGTQQTRSSNFQRSRTQPGMESSWDTQYWSLWITDNGGGTFKNIWSANTFATSGIYVSNTSTPGHIYELSVEHHVRNEVRFKDVSNWKVYALQLEEESRESWNCQPMELENCKDDFFANLYMFRVIRIKNPYPYAVRLWNCKDLEFLNVHNYTQIKYTTTVPFYDINTNQEVRPWEIGRLWISGNTQKQPFAPSGKVQKLVKGFEFADGICSDSKGNIYFSESRWKRIYKWSVENNSLSLVADFPWEPLSLACDSKDNLLVVFKYVPQPGYLVNGKEETFPNPPDAAGTSFSGWGNSGFGVFVYSINPENPEETIQKLEKAEMRSVKKVYKALYPSNRWRDYHDFNTIVQAKNKECYVAPDGVTIIPINYDLARAVALVEAFPGKPVYISDEYDKRIVRLNTDSEGYLSDLKYFVEKGEFSTAVDQQGNVYVADGEIYVYDKEGKQTGLIKVPERPITISFGGKDNNMLFVTTASSLYSIKL